VSLLRASFLLIAVVAAAACGDASDASSSDASPGRDGAATGDGGGGEPECASPSPLFAVDFESNAPTYGFEELYPVTGRMGDVVHYGEEHLATGGFGGTGGSHLTALAGESQFQMGWLWSGAGPGGGWTWGDTIYIRFRIRFDDDYRWDGSGSQQNKMLDIGGGANARMILHNERDNPTTPCGLNHVDYDLPGNPVSNTAEDYGLPAGSFDGGDWGAFSLKNGIDVPCTPPVAITHGVWYHVQVGVRLSSASGAADGFFMLWINDNDPMSPSSEARDIIRELDEWNTSWDFGGYWTNSNGLRPSSWVVDDLEVDTAFDCQWAPAGAEPARVLP